MLASTWFDLVIGVDLHFELVPPPMVPTPFPHPFVGLVFDPIGLAAGLAISNAIGMAMGGPFKGPVLINGLPANTTGTEAKNAFILPHFIIPPGTMWAPMVRVPKPAIIPGKAPELELPIPPPGDAVMITGSKTVHAMGANLCRLGDLALSCSDPVRLPSSTVLAIPKGLPVLVGGPPAVDWMAAAFGLIKCKWVSSKLHKLVSRIKNARIRSFLHKTVCFLTGHPVDVATGRVLTDAVDFELPGPLPLRFERAYDSSLSFRDSSLGYGWSHSLDQAVWLEPGCVVYRAEDGREIEFDTFDLPDHVIRPGEEVFEPVNRLLLRSLGKYRWEVETAEGIVHELAPVVGDADKTMARLMKKRSRQGHTIELHYDAKARLEWVRDCAGRLIRFEHDDAGRLTQISLPHPSQGGWVPHTRYEYSPEGDLVEVYDSLKHVTVYEYAGHLLVRETDRTGLSFYFGYDGIGSSAYCIRTWGDGGIYDHAIDYDKQGRVTYVTDSLGGTTTYEMNVANAVVKITDALGSMRKYECDDNLWKTTEIDELGYTTRYEYDARGNCTKIVDPRGMPLLLEYNAFNQAVRTVDACGGEWRWTYDDRGQIRQYVNPLGETTWFEHNGGQVSAVINSAGMRTEFTYDHAKNLRAVRLAHGAEEAVEHDALGRMILRRDVRGNVEQRHYDASGRLHMIEEPDGNVRRLSYDSEGNVVEARDHRRQLRLRYSGYHWLTEREEEADAKVQFLYDTEGRLVEVKNEAGEVYRFGRDACGRVREERGFDGRVYRYTRNEAGNVVRVIKPSGAVTELVYNATQDITHVRRSDGTEDRFLYRDDGALLEAVSSTVTVRFERDFLGRVVREEQGEHWVESRFDAMGARVGIQSSLGASTIIARNAMGDVEDVTVGNGTAQWRAEFERDALGLETERRLPGGITALWQRDQTGRPVTRKIGRRSESLTSLEYHWNPGYQLAAIVDSTVGLTEFEHDARGRLVAARHEGGHVERRAADVVGNLYRDPGHGDRLYGPGGELREAEGVRYRYDADGNLIEKIEPNGSHWKYEWNAAGQLRKVIRPDGRTVTFAYDALGRRIMKRWGEEERTWIWDGHIVLHEVVSRAEPVTWVFEPESFAPLGKFQGGQSYSIITDHLGTPNAIFDDIGEVTWVSRLDLYGTAKDEVAKTSCPWRWPGQYEDPETGLYYNRFRYYDPATGRYLSPDPLELRGGLNAYAYVPDPTTASDPLGLIIVWHYTSDAGAKGIQSRGRDMWHFMASTPPGGRPFGVYFTSLFSPEMTSEHHRMGIPAEKRTHFFAVEVVDDKFDDLFRPLPGGRGHTGVSIYVPNDLEVMKILQNDWFNKKNRSSRTVRQAGCGKV